MELKRFSRVVKCSSKSRAENKGSSPNRWLSLGKEHMLCFSRLKQLACTCSMMYVVFLFKKSYLFVQYLTVFYIYIEIIF